MGVLLFSSSLPSASNCTPFLSCFLCLLKAAIQFVESLVFVCVCVFKRGCVSLFLSLLVLNLLEDVRHILLKSRINFVILC